MSIEHHASPIEAISFREQVLVNQTVKNDHLFLFGEDGRSGFVGETNRYIDRQQGVLSAVKWMFATMTALSGVTVAIVTWMAFFKH